LSKKGLEEIIRGTKRVDCIDEYLISSKKDKVVTETGVEYCIENGKVKVPDHYRWLENIENEEVSEWIDKQNTLTNQVLKDSEGRDGVR